MMEQSGGGDTSVERRERRARWEGGVDETLKNMDGRLGAVETKVDALPDKIASRMVKVINGQSTAQPPPSDPSKVDFKWLAEKLLLPVVLIVASIIIAAALGGG